MDGQPEIDKVRVKARSSISPDDLQAEINALDDPFEELWERNTVPFEEIRAKRLILLREFVKKQIKERDKYQNIFRMAQGSLYFTLASGESLRIKQRGEEWEIQPMCRKIFYVDSQQAASLLAMQERISFQEAIIGTLIETVACGIGVTPVEFGIIHMSEIHFKEESGKIIIEGDNTGVFASGYHQGNPITEVLK